METRVDNLQSSITHTLFDFVTRGLFERHRIIFRTQLAIKVLQAQTDERGERLISSRELSVLIDNPREPVTTNPLASWLPDASWGAVLALAELEPFASLAADVEGSQKRWREWYEHPQSETEPLPQEWKRLSPFHQLMIVRALRPDRMTLAVTSWAASVLGERYGAAVGFDLAASFVDAGPATPIFFLLSPGVDPAADVRALAKTLGKTEDAGLFVGVSLGQGQVYIYTLAPAIAPPPAPACTVCPPRPHRPALPCSPPPLPPPSSHLPPTTPPPTLHCLFLRLSHPPPPFCRHIVPRLRPRLRQERVAEKALDQMHLEGGWVMLENIELVAAWLPQLEKKLESLEEKGAHPEFRVFLSAMPQDR